MVIVKTNDRRKEIIGVYQNHQESWDSLKEFVDSDYDAFKDCYIEEEVLEGIEDFTDSELAEVFQLLRGGKYSQEIINIVAEKIATFANDYFEFYDHQNDSWDCLYLFPEEEREALKYRADRFYIYDGNMNQQEVSLAEFIKDCI